MYFMLMMYFKLYSVGESGDLVDLFPFFNSDSAPEQNGPFPGEDQSLRETSQTLLSQI